MIKNYKGGYSILINYEEIYNKYKNYINEVPQNFIDFKEKRDGKDFHLTVITPNEVADIQINKNAHFDIIGLGINDSCYYLVCVSKELDELRKINNLESKDFHITLGFNYSDKHNISKSISSLVKKEDNLIELIIKNLSSDNKKNIKILKELNQIVPNNFLIIKNLINQLSIGSYYNDALINSRLLIDLYSKNILSYYIYLLLCNKLELFEINYYDIICSNILKVNLIDDNKIINETIKILNLFTINYSKKIYFINMTNKIK